MSTVYLILVKIFQRIFLRIMIQNIQNNKQQPGAVKGKMNKTMFTDHVKKQIMK